MNIVDLELPEEELPEIRERRLAALKKVLEEIEAEPPRELYPPPEDLIREDRER